MKIIKYHTNVSYYHYCSYGQRLTTMMYKNKSRKKIIFKVPLIVNFTRKVLTFPVHQSSGTSSEDQYSKNYSYIGGYTLQSLFYALTQENTIGILEIS